MMLKMLGHETHCVYDPRQATGAVETFAPDVVFLDIGMPGLSGYDVARSLRAVAAGATLTLVAVTGWGHAEDRRRTAEAGFDHHLVKPADMAAISAICNALTPRRAGCAPERAVAERAMAACSMPRWSTLRSSAANSGFTMAAASTTLAVLIDADNAQPAVVDGLLAEIAKYGTATVKRIYGDWTGPQLKGWKETLLTHAIQPIQQFRYTTGKNATDSALIIDAMDLLYTRPARRFLHRVERQRFHAARGAHPRSRARRLWLRRKEDAGAVRVGVRQVHLHRNPRREGRRGRRDAEAALDRRSSSRTAGSSRCCATRPKPRPTTPAGRISARSAARSPSRRPSSTRATTAIASSASWSRPADCSTSRSARSATARRHRLTFAAAGANRGEFAGA